MRAVLLNLSAVWFLLTSIQAMEMDDTLPIYIHNKSWSTKTRLALQVAYLLKVVVEDPDKDIKLHLCEVILDGVSSQTPITTEAIPVPKGNIQSIGLCLTNYRPILSSSNTRETEIASLIFEPTDSPLLGISFTINTNKIIPLPSYALPLQFPNESASASASLSLTEDGAPKA